MITVLRKKYVFFANMNFPIVMIRLQTLHILRHFHFCLLVCVQRTQERCGCFILSFCF